jgi:hypothetical protein
VSVAAVATAQAIAKVAASPHWHVPLIERSPWVDLMPIDRS